MRNGLVCDCYGTMEWYKDDQLHREDGPAVVQVYGKEEWYQHGERHREDGPAVVTDWGSSEWWYRGVYVGHGVSPDPALWARLTSGPLNGHLAGLHGVNYWFKDDQFHREDGPAIEWNDGTQFWYLNGEWLGNADIGFWKMWDRSTPEQRGNPTLLRWMPH